MVTYCLGDFARRLSRAPLDEWKALVESMPDKCDRCKTTCRKACGEYAKVQWKCAKRRSK